MNIKLDIPYDLSRCATQLWDATLYENRGAHWLAVHAKSGMIAVRQELEGETVGQALDEAYALLAAWRGFDEEALEMLGVQS